MKPSGSDRGACSDHRTEPLSPRTLPATESPVITGFGSLPMNLIDLRRRHIVCNKCRFQSNRQPVIECNCPVATCGCARGQFGIYCQTCTHWPTTPPQKQQQAQHGADD